MSDVFRIDGPACVSFSGGRTSALMLRRILDAYDGALPDDVLAVFANTGKEREETLTFVDECARRWGIAVRWVEHRPRKALDAELLARVLGVLADHGVSIDVSKLEPVEAGFVEVNHDTASRNGEPFLALVVERRFLPNPVARICTQELKLRPMKRWAQALGLRDWTNAVGLRADEPRRVSRMRAADRREVYDVALPLAEAGVTVEDVATFWREQPFDLALRSWEGNCDLCYLKGRAKKLRIIADGPERAQWWAALETALEMARGDDARFRHDSPSYAALAAMVSRQIRLPLVDDCALDDLGDCTCTD